MSFLFLYFNVQSIEKKMIYTQTWSNDYKRLLNKPYENEVTLTGQNPPLKCCQHLEIQYTMRKKVDL